MANIKRNSWVDAYRFILICIIVIHHYTLRYPQIYPDAAFDFQFKEGGIIGNFVFMYISGYFLTNSLLNGYGVRDWFKYCLNKWWRFFPTAVICMVIIFIITHLSPLTDERMVNMPQLLLNFLIVNPGFKPVDGSHWFIASLLQMQLLLSILMFIKSSRVKMIVLYSFFILAAFLYLLGDIKAFAFDNVLRAVLCEKWMPVLLAGSFTKLICEKKIPAAILLIPITVIGYYVIQYNTLSVVVLILVFLFICLKVPQIKCPIFLQKLGEMSFVWYLLHQNIGYCIINELRGYGIQRELYLIFLAMTLTLALSCIVYVCIRKIPTKIL